MRAAALISAVPPTSIISIASSSGTERCANLGSKRLDVDDDQVDQLDTACCKLLQLAFDLAVGKDARVDVGVEGLDLAAGE